MADNKFDTDMVKINVIMLVFICLGIITTIFFPWKVALVVAIATAGGFSFRQYLFGLDNVYGSSKSIRVLLKNIYQRLSSLAYIVLILIPYFVFGLFWINIIIAAMCFLILQYLLLKQLKENTDDYQCE